MELYLLRQMVQKAEGRDGESKVTFRFGKVRRVTAKDLIISALFFFSSNENINDKV